MISRIASYITGLYVENAVIAFEDKENYQYGFERGILKIINVITTLAIGILLKMPLESLFFLISFMTLRTYTGGYHSSSNIKCYVLSVTVTVSVLTAGKYIACSGLDYLVYISILFGIIGICLLIWLAPVEDQNKPMDKVEKVVFRKRAMRNLLIWSAVTVILFFTPWQTSSIVLCFCLFAMGITVVCGLLKNNIINKNA